MARLKVAKGLITNEKSRRLKFAKRKKSLIKKLIELSTLCDVRVGLILYEEMGNSDISPEIYPEDPQEIKHLINKYTEQPIADCKRWNTNLSTVLKSWKMKAEIDITKLQESTMVKRSKNTSLLSPPSWDGTNLEDLSEGQLAEFGKLIDKKIENVNKAYESKQNQQKVGPTTTARRSHILDMTTQAVAQPIQLFDITKKAQTVPPSRVHIPPPIAVQQTIISHPYHPMQSLKYNMQLGTVYQHQQQSIMPFVYPQNVSIPTQYQVNETSSFNDKYYNQMESTTTTASLQYDHHLHHHRVGEYAMWYPPGNPNQAMVPYLQYYHGMLSNGDSAKWQMNFSSQGNYGPKNFHP